MKPEKYVVSLSGGKDSTAMLLRLLEEKRSVDLILFCDTGLEFPQMYEHLDRLEKYIGRPIIRLKAERDFEYYFYEYTPRRKNPALSQYRGMSWPGARGRWCTGFLKTHVINAYLKELKKRYMIIEYVGIAADEIKRIKDKNYPLAEWGMTEQDCLFYCYRRGLIGAAYMRFSAVFPAGAVPCKVWRNCESSIGTSQIYGGSLKNGTIPLGEPFSKAILSARVPPVLILRTNGRKTAAISVAGRFTLLCGRNCPGSKRR